MSNAEPAASAAEVNQAVEFLAWQLSANAKPGGPRWWCMRKPLKDHWRATAEELIERWVQSETQAEARATEMGLNLPPAERNEKVFTH